MYKVTELFVYTFVLIYVANGLNKEFLNPELHNAKINCKKLTQSNTLRNILVKYNKRYKTHCCTVFRK